MAGRWICGWDVSVLAARRCSATTVPPHQQRDSSAKEQERERRWDGDANFFDGGVSGPNIDVGDLFPAKIVHIPIS